ncbi:hypothetical protein [Hymenobacter sp. DG01]|uniref:hypothetical protein n=1 Tax=Hymenobacter sp. DG01 TaxID=2584940 RepID=UPI00111DC18E|nr:hypothetical protein [Hymenobacter sp. DG01]
MLDALDCPLKTRRLYYDLPPGSTPPAADTFLVSVVKGKGDIERAIGTVYHIVSARARKVQQPQCSRYFLEVVAAPDMKPYTALSCLGTEVVVTVKGAAAHPLYWYPRRKASGPAN